MANEGPLHEDALLLLYLVCFVDGAGTLWAANYRGCLVADTSPL
jgi:hypothetical protein